MKTKTNLPTSRRIPRGRVAERPTLTKDGVQWTGVTSAYIFALVLDAGLIALLIWCATGHAA